MHSILHIFANYTWAIAGMHLFLAVLLFFIVNWLGAKSISKGYTQIEVTLSNDTAPAFNFLYKVFAPVVYMILCAVIFQETNLEKFNTCLYLVVFYYWLFRIGWRLAMQRSMLTNWVGTFVYFFFSMALSYWVYTLLSNVEDILPSPRALIDQLWIVIIIFIYSALNKVEVSSYANEKRNNKYLSYNYEKFHEKYDSIIKPAFNNGFYEALVYSIMIHENFNRPPVVRWIEYARMHLTKRRHTLGIMQVKSDKIIDDATSIGIAIDMIIEINNKLYEEHKEHSFYSLGSFALMIAHKYNPGDHLYSSAVRDIYEYIAEKYYEDVPSKFEKLNRNSTEQPNEELKK